MFCCSAKEIGKSQKVAAHFRMFPPLSFDNSHTQNSLSSFFSTNVNHFWSSDISACKLRVAMSSRKNPKHLDPFAKFKSRWQISSRGKLWERKISQNFFNLISLWKKAEAGKAQRTEFLNFAVNLSNNKNHLYNNFENFQGTQNTIEKSISRKF